MFEPTDSELIKRAQNGDAEAVAHLYDRHRERIFKYIRVRIYNQQTAEDLTGELFLRMVRTLPDYKDSGAPFAAWLYRIAYNLIVDHVRKEGKHMSTPLQQMENLAEARPGPLTIMEKQFTLEQVQQALDTLEDGQREVIILRFMMGFSLKEVAGTLDKSVAAVKSLQYRGLGQLRLIMKGQGGY